MNKIFSLFCGIFQVRCLPLCSDPRKGLRCDSLARELSRMTADMRRELMELATEKVREK